MGCKRAPFSMQKDSFWRAKGLVLEGKRTRFGRQKESFFECGMLNVECEINFGYACDCELYNYEFNIQHSTFHIL